jgi:hypothetical protein
MVSESDVSRSNEITPECVFAKHTSQSKVNIDFLAQLTFWKARHLVVYLNRSLSWFEPCGLLHDRTCLPGFIANSQRRR